MIPTPSAARTTLPATQPRKPAGTPAAVNILRAVAGVIGALSPIRRIDREAEQAMRAGVAARISRECARQECERHHRPWIEAAQPFGSHGPASVENGAVGPIGFAPFHTDGIAHG